MFLTVIIGLADKVAQVHGSQHAELWSLAKRVKILIGELLDHIEKEEKYSFLQLNL